MNEPIIQNTIQQEDMNYHIGTDGKCYPDPTPANYPWFGAERLQYMKRNEPEFYQEMVATGKLNAYFKRRRDPCTGRTKPNYVVHGKARRDK